MERTGLGMGSHQEMTYDEIWAKVNTPGCLPQVAGTEALDDRLGNAGPRVDDDKASGARATRCSDLVPADLLELGGRRRLSLGLPRESGQCDGKQQNETQCDPREPPHMDLEEL